jgi:hypothetical protein
MSTQPELLPCPLCGPGAVYLNAPSEEYRHGSINCAGCMLTLPGEIKDQREMIEVWNTRHAPVQEARTCTCHPDDNPPVPCAQKFAYSECVAAQSARMPDREAIAEIASFLEGCSTATFYDRIKNDFANHAKTLRALALADPAPETCAECNCGDGVCNWIAPAPHAGEAEIIERCAKVLDEAAQDWKPNSRSRYGQQCTQLRKKNSRSCCRSR